MEKVVRIASTELVTFEHRFEISKNESLRYLQGEYLGRGTVCTKALRQDAPGVVKEQ